MLKIFTRVCLLDKFALSTGQGSKEDILKIVGFKNRIKMLIPHRVQEIVNSISHEFHNTFSEDVVLIWFGSWVKGDAYLQSDIDLAIKYHKQVDSETMLKFRDYLDLFPTLYKIDLIDTKAVGKHLNAEIDAYGKIL